MQTTHDLTAHRIPVADLTYYPGNPRRGDIDFLKRSLSDHGQAFPIAVQRSTGFVVKGNNTLRAAVALGWSHIVGVYLDIDDDQAKRLLLADNAASERGDYDGEDLAALLTSLDGDLTGTGYDDDALGSLVARLDGQYRPTEWVALDTIRPHPRNYRDHPQEQIDRICDSIRLLGFYRSIVIAREGTILAGHGIALASQALGLDRVPVIRLDVDPDEPGALKVLVSDNELANLAAADDHALTAILRDLLEADDLTATGFDEQQLAALEFLIRPPAYSGPEEWIGMPEWQSENHDPELRLYFDTEDDRKALIELLKLTHVSTRGHGVMFCRWPDRGNKKRLDVVFQEAESNGEESHPAGGPEAAPAAVEVTS